MDNPIENPLLQAPGLSSIAGWLADPKLLVHALIHSPVPFAGECELPLKQRRGLTDQYQKIFVPTHQSMRIADRILSVLHQGLERRNPTWPEVQRWINSTQQWYRRSVDEIPWNPVQAKGIILEGITGIGKSHVVERVLGLLPQIVDHEPRVNGACSSSGSWCGSRCLCLQTIPDEAYWLPSWQRWTECLRLSITSR